MYSFQSKTYFNFRPFHLNAFILGIMSGCGGFNSLSSSVNLTTSTAPSPSPSIAATSSVLVVTDVTKGVNSTVNGSAVYTFTAPTALPYSFIGLMADSSFSAQNVCYPNSFFGLFGLANCSNGANFANSSLPSGVMRGMLSAGITTYQETTTYAGSQGAGASVLPTTGNYSFDEVPRNRDLNDNFFGYCSSPSYGSASTCNGAGLTWVGFCINPNYTTSGTCASHGTWVGTGGSQVININANVHTAMGLCGGPGFSSIAASMQDCASKNPNVYLWNGSVMGSSNQGSWQLVTVAATNKEVWQDLTTGLLWSTSSTTTANWCNAAGNNDPTDTICSGNRVSFCNENLYPQGGTPTAGFSGDTLVTGPYSSAKGMMGVSTTPAIRWNLPTLSDFKQAYIDGIVDVMPGYLGANQTGNATTYCFWTRTIWPYNRLDAWAFCFSGYQFSYSSRSSNNYAVCVGR